MLPSHPCHVRLPGWSLLRPLVVAAVLCGVGLPGRAAAQSWKYRVLHAQAGPRDGVMPESSLVEGADGSFYGTTSGGGPFNNGTIFKVTPAGAVTTLYSFTGADDGRAPASALVLGQDGNFYGTTPSGGASNAGTIFKFSVTGALTTLHSFSGGSDGGTPEAALVDGDDGNFYGTTSRGGTLIDGTQVDGTIFQVNLTGSVKTLHTFAYSSDGAEPSAALVRGSDGIFYGTTRVGGPAGGGTVFKCTSAGGFTVLHGFDGPSPDQSGGMFPLAPLVQGVDGNFYGTTSGGGSGFNNGTVFRITPTGLLTTVARFSNGGGVMPQAGLVVGGDGNLYGTTLGSGGVGAGTVFQVTPGGALTTVHTFNGGDGQRPEGALVPGSDGNLYGTTSGGGSVGAGTVFAVSTAGNFASVHSFVYGDDGAHPSGPVVPAGDGDLYGVTANGGPANKGTVYRVDRQGAQTVLATFTGANGELPNGGLLLGGDNNFYGVTEYGGTGNFGTIFRMTPRGALTTIHTFKGAIDGSYPRGGLILASDGDFYGVANEGGAHDEGTIFKLDAKGKLTVLHVFDFNTEGAFPVGPLVEGTDGNFYGVIVSAPGLTGGAFRMTPSGVVTLLHTFAYATDGFTPNGGLIQAGDGGFYGTAGDDGPKNGGTLFRVTGGGGFNVVHAFDPVPDGSNPPAGLTLGSDGNFYGTASVGGANDTGTIYKLTADGAFSVLHVFDAAYGDKDNHDGVNPSAALVQDANGNFYGVTGNGGAAGAGTVFELSLVPPHPAFFTGEVALANGVYYLDFAGGNPFGYYSYLTDPAYIYHFDLGYEYVFDANDGKSGVYFYDFASGTFFYTSPTFAFPYLYDFGLNSVVYYYPDPNNAGHYNSGGVRYFYVFNTGEIISK